MFNAVLNFLGPDLVHSDSSDTDKHRKKKKKKHRHHSEADSTLDTTATDGVLTPSVTGTAEHVFRGSLSDPTKQVPL